MGEGAVRTMDVHLPTTEGVKPSSQPTILGAVKDWR